MYLEATTMGIAIFGLNGAGKSTLTHALAKKLNFYEIDVEDYYFPEQRESRRQALEQELLDAVEPSAELPYSNPKSKKEVQEAILSDIKAHPKFIISGVSMNWCEEILSNIELAFWVKAPLEERLKRIQQREEKRFGARTLAGGDMYEQQKEFRRVVAGREERSLEETVAKLPCPVVILDGTMPVEDNIEKIIAEGKKNDARRVTSPDGPTAYFIIDRNQKLTWKQRCQKWWFGKKKAWVAKGVKADPHTLDEVCKYIKTKHGFTELSEDTEEYLEEYREMRAGLLMRYAPELLGELKEMPQPEGRSEEDIKRYMEAFEVRKKAALQVPKGEFDIEFHKFKKQMGDSEIHITVEKRYLSISGGAGGSKKTVKKFDKIYKDIYRYYGVTKEDIENKSKRYEELLRTLAR